MIRAQQQRRWDPEADGLGGPEVDDELEFRRALHRQIARLSPLEDPVHITGGAPKRIEEGGSVRKEPTRLGEEWYEETDCGKPVLDRNLGDA